MIAFENAAYSYGGGELLSEISLRLAPGSFHFLTGPSGSGKSTFLKLCYAELMPTAGRLTLFDREVRALSRDDVALTRRRIGVVHQDCQFLDHLPLAANVALPLTVAGRVSPAADLTDLLGWVGLGNWPTRCHRRCRAANASAPPSPAPSSWGRMSFWRMNPPATLTGICRCAS